MTLWLKQLHKQPCEIVQTPHSFRVEMCTAVIGHIRFKFRIMYLGQFEHLKDGPIQTLANFIDPFGEVSISNGKC